MSFPTRGRALENLGTTKGGKANKPKRAFLIRLGLAVLVMAGLIVAFLYFPPQPLLKRILEWIDSLGTWGPFFFIAAYVLATVLFVPGSILTLGAGALFGPLKGTVIVSTASTLGATCAFLVGRYLARDWVARQIETRPAFKSIDEAVAREGWKIVGLTRLSPVFPFNLLNYAFGLTRVPLRDYFFASWIGMLPGTVLYVYIGSLAGNLAGIGAARTRTAAEWAFYLIGLAATTVVTVLLTRLARASLRKKI